MERSIGWLVARAATRFGEKTALIVGDRSWSFRDLDTMASRIASAPVAGGIAPGDVVSLYAPNSHEWVVSYYGILKAGAVVNPLNLMLTPQEAAFAINDCGARAVMGSRDKIAGLQGAPGIERVSLRIAWGTTFPTESSRLARSRIAARPIGKYRRSIRWRSARSAIRRAPPAIPKGPN